MPEVRIKTDFGEIAIPYKDTTELEKELADIQKVVEIVESKVDWIKKIDAPQLKQGYDDIYHINSDGTISILMPGSSTENIGIILFAYDPKILKVKAIEKMSGAINVTQYLKGKHFRKEKFGMYKLTVDGLNWVVNEVIPKLRARKQK